MPAPKIVYKDAIKFCEHYLGKDCFAPFTGYDWSAWRAFVYLLEAYGRADRAGQAYVLGAVQMLLQSPQTKVLNVFVQAIPAVLDWHHIEGIWPRIAPNGFCELRARTAPTGRAQ